MARILLRTSVLLPLLATALGQNATSPCLQFLGMSEASGAGVTVNIAQDVAAGTVFTGQTLNGGYNAPQYGLPGYCRVAAQFNTSASSTVHFEVWMPISDAWNRRFLAVGNGGWNGAVNYPDVARGLKMNFASMSTNTGHNSSSGDGKWFQFPEQNIDFGHRGLHLAVEHAKDLIAAYYGSAPSWSYYMGCSTGGRQGFAEAQLYPEDFDGILVGCPVIWQTHLQAWENYVSKGQYPSTLVTHIPSKLWTVIHDEAVRQCDHIDGVVDGLISDPSRCNFAPEPLLCRGSDTSNCLTPAQLTNLKTLYAGWTDAGNTLVYPGVPIGSELTGLQAYTNSPTPGGYGLDYFRYAILNTTDWISMDIDYADVQVAEKVHSYGALADAFDPDLSAFQGRGGKILHYHGWQDSIVNTGVSPLYYSSVLSHFSGTGIDVADFFRLFLVPGMAHCSGGDGAWVLGVASQGVESPVNDTMHSGLLALVEWREKGTAPEKLMGTRYANTTAVNGELVDKTVSFSRPVCPWPKAPVFVGSDVNDAKSWTCTLGNTCANKRAAKVARDVLVNCGN